MDHLAGKVAVVTGAASGIGLALATRFVAEGAKVVLADIEEPALVAAATELSGRGGDVLAVVTDVSDPASVTHLRDETLATYGAVHVVCNNAGVAPVGPMLATTPADWQWILGVNVAGVAYGITTFAPLLVAQGEGHIVNTASEAGLATTDILGMYCATKHAVVGMSEALYRELEPTGVGVSVLCPNLVRTQIFHSERNRPDEFTPTAGQHELQGLLRESLDALGISTEKVADDVVAAVLANRFWIFTHDTTPAVAGVRFADIAAGRNPTPPYAPPAQ